MHDLHIYCYDYLLWCYRAAEARQRIRDHKKVYQDLRVSTSQLNYAGVCVVSVYEHAFTDILLFGIRISSNCVKFIFVKVHLLTLGVSRDAVFSILLPAKRFDPRGLLQSEPLQRSCYLSILVYSIYW